MKIDPKFLKELTLKACMFEEIAELFALTEEQKVNPKAAEWIIDRIKQLQTAYMIRKSTTEKVDFPKDTPSEENR